MNGNAIKVLNSMIMSDLRNKYPEVKEGWLPQKGVKVGNANQLTQAIIKFLQLSGHQAERISVTGRRIDQRTTYKDVLGQTRQIGSVKWIKSSMQKGSADISAIVRCGSGVSVAWKIEVKWGKDRIRPEQEVYRDQVIKAGGHYSIVKTFDDFYEQYKELIER